MDFFKSLAIAPSGLHAQIGRMQVIAQNIANADSTSPANGGDPYRRKIVTFRSELDRSLDTHVIKLGQVESPGRSARWPKPTLPRWSRIRHWRGRCMPLWKSTRKSRRNTIAPLPKSSAT